MTKKQNPNSILFLYEGPTEGEFYSKIFSQYIPKRKIRINYSSLNGKYNLNGKVKKKIMRYLSEKKYDNNVHVIVGYDRDGNRQKKGSLNKQLLLSDPDITNSLRIKKIIETIATQDIESWFFKDIEGIYQFLKVPKKRRRRKYNNPESFNKKDLSQLFHKYGRHYQKGTKVSGFLEKLDMDKILNKTPELTSAINYLISLTK